MLTSNWSITWPCRRIHRLSMGQLCWLNWLQKQKASGLKQRLIVWVLSVTEWLVSNVATRILIHTYKLSTSNKILSPLRIFVSQNPGVPRNPLWEALLQTILCLFLNSWHMSKNTSKKIPDLSKQARRFYRLCAEVVRLVKRLIPSTHHITPAKRNFDQQSEPASN
jgi:hypothetical protein